MKKRLNQILQITLGFITVIFFILISIVVYSLSKKNIVDFFYPFLLYIGAFLSFTFVLFFRKRKIYFFSAILFIILTIGANAFSNYKNSLYTEHSTIWNNTEHSTIIPFYAQRNGHIFIKASIDNHIQYLNFDTGNDVIGLNEKYNNSEKNETITIKDSHNKTSELAINNLARLSIGDIDFKGLDYIALKKNIWDNENGIFYNKDSIAGILGNNIINSFVWDFDIKKQTIKITDQKFSESLSKTHIVPLIKSGKGWKVKIKVNGKQEFVKLDSGSNKILSITDSLKTTRNSNHEIKEESNGIFSFTETDNDGNKKKIMKRMIFADINISNLFFKDALIMSPSKSNLLGVPLFWEYDRIVLDFLDQKMYLFNKLNSTNAPSITNKSNRFRK